MLALLGAFGRFLGALGPSLAAPGPSWAASDEDKMQLRKFKQIVEVPQVCLRNGALFFAFPGWL